MIRAGLFFFSVLTLPIFLFLAFSLRVSMHEVALAALLALSVFFFSMHLRKYFIVKEQDKSSSFLHSSKAVLITSFALSFFIVFTLSGSFKYAWEMFSEMLSNPVYLFLGVIFILLPVVVGVWVTAMALIMSVLRVTFESLGISQRKKDLSYVILTVSFAFVLFLIMESAGEVLREAIVEDSVTSLMRFTMGVIPILWAYDLFITPLKSI